MTALKIADSLLQALDVQTSDYYLAHTETVVALLAANRTEVQQQVDRKKARARFRWEERRDLGHEQLAAMAERGLDTMFDSDDIGVVPTSCPVCGYDGSLEAYLDVDYAVEVEWSDGDQTTSVHPFWQVYPLRFKCHICGFAVTGAEELLAAGLPTEQLTPEAHELRTDWNIAEFIAENPTDGRM